MQKTNRKYTQRILFYEFKGKIKKLLNEDIKSSKNNILKLVYKRREYI